MAEEEKIIEQFLKEGETEIRIMSIIKDKHQYSIRLPKDFAETIKETIGDPEKLKFRFILKLPSPKSKSKPKLIGELAYEEKQS